MTSEKTELWPVTFQEGIQSNNGFIDGINVIYKKGKKIGAKQQMNITVHIKMLNIEMLRL